MKRWTVLLIACASILNVAPSIAEVKIDLEALKPSEK